MEFTKTKQTQQNIFTAENENYRYEIAETTQDGKRDLVTMNVMKKTDQGDRRSGYMTLQNGQKATTFPESEDAKIHIDVFEEFLNHENSEE